MPIRSGTESASDPSPPAEAPSATTSTPAVEAPAGPAAGPGAVGSPVGAAGPRNARDPVDIGGGSVWASREYRALWAAAGLSITGDQLARVALTVLLFQVTGSAIWASVGGAVALLAPVAGGLLLSKVGDRRPRRQVMVACDVASAVLIAAMALPGMPLPVLVVLLGVASGLYGPFNAARMALTRDVLGDNRRYAKAIGANALTFQVAILFGALAGGAAVGLVGVRGALLLDAGTFVVSAVLVRGWVANRPAARPGPGQQDEVGPSEESGRSASGPAVSGLRLVITDPTLRTSALYAWMAVFRIAPSGVAAPYAAAHGGGAALLGVVLSLQGIGLLVGTVLLTRLPFTRQQRWLVPGSVLACAPLIGTVGDPGVTAVMVLWVAAGVGSAYMIVAQTLFMAAVPNSRRAEAGGLVSSLLLGVQGVGMLAAAALAEVVGPADAVAVFGIAGTIAALALVPAGRRLTADPPAAGRPVGDRLPGAAAGTRTA